MRRYLLLLFLLTPALPSWGASADLPDFQLLDTAGRSHTLHRYRDASAVVLMAVPREDAGWRRGCAISRRWRRRRRRRRSSASP